MKSSIPLILFLFLLNTGLYSQTDSIQTKRKNIFPKEITENEFARNYSLPLTVDTDLTRFQHYKLKNDLGNNGLAIVPLSPTLPHFSTGFHYMPDAFSHYLFTRENRKYYTCIDPFTELVFFLGQKKEQGFRFTHTQNVNKNLNFAAFFSRVRSDGFYKQQNTNHNSFSITSNYLSKRKKYFLISAFSYNKLNNNENGGIEKDSAFENSVLNDRKLLAVKLDEANRAHRNKLFLLKQYFNTGILEKNGSDTLSPSLYVPRHSFVHSFSAEDHSILYQDNNPTSGFYDNIFLDSVKTYDSVYFYTLKNEIRWQSLINKSSHALKPLGAALGVRHEYTWFTEDVLDTSLENIIALAEFFSTSIPRSNFSLKIESIVSGSRKNEFSADLYLKYFAKDSTGYFSVKGMYKDYMPDFIFNYYHSNHYRWVNSFSRQATAMGELNFTSAKYKFSLGCTMNYFSNYIYLDSYAYPSQHSGSFTVLSPFLRKDFHLGKFHFTNSVTWQNVQKNTPLHLPEFITRHSLFYENMIFKKALHFQAGVDVFYYASYYSDNYSPALGMFYLQDKKNTGNYPIADVFINMKIKTARVFIKYEHLNAALMGFQYYGAPSYPLPDRALKFGISWMMFN